MIGVEPFVLLLVIELNDLKQYGAIKFHNQATCEAVLSSSTEMERIRGYMARQKVSIKKVLGCIKRSTFELAVKGMDRDTVQLR